MLEDSLVVVLPATHSGYSRTETIIVPASSASWETSPRKEIFKNTNKNIDKNSAVKRNRNKKVATRVNTSNQVEEEKEQVKSKQEIIQPNIVKNDFL